MSFFSNLMGNNGSGLNFKASGTRIDDPATVAQATTAYDQTQEAIAKQAAFLQALQAQNGIANQSQVFNQLQDVAAGQGPNPAQAALQQATGNNIANQAALMAGQRGASANPALLARQAAQQGANIQQQSIGQGANLQAQQSLNALNQLGGIAGQQVGQEAAATTGLNQATQSQQQNLLNSVNAQNNARVQMQSNINNANAGIQGIAAQGQTGLVSGLLGGVGTALMAEGGEVKQPSSSAGKFLYSSAPVAATPAFDASQTMQQGAAGMAASSSKLAQGIIGAIAKSGAPAAPMGSVAGSAPGVGGNVAMPMAAHGAMIPGAPAVKGDSEKNDTVPALLSPGEIVIPRSVVNSKNPTKAAADFVAAVLAKHGKMSKKPKGK